MRNVASEFSFVALLLAFALVGCDSGGTSGMDDSSEPEETTPTPSISSVSPNEGAIGTELSIEGSNFQSDAGVQVGEKAASEVEVSSESQIYAKVPADIQYHTPVSVVVENADAARDTIETAFTAIDPVLKFVNSATKPSGQVGSTVIFDGRAFGDAQRSGQVFFSDGAGGSVSASIDASDDWTDSFIVTTVPSGAEDGPVWVETEVGRSDSIEFNVTDGASFSPSNITWTSTTPLPTGVSGHAARYAAIENSDGATERYVYVTGGRDSQDNGLSQVLSGRIDQQGEITEWTALESLPAPRSFHASVTATPFNSRVQGDGYIYVLGGTDDAGNPTTTVSKAEIQSDGSSGTWEGATALPEPLHSAGAVVFRSAIYVVGGATDANQPVTSVYKASIDTLGNLGEWEEETSLPSARSYHGLASFGGYLYAVGGETDSVAPDDGDYQNNETKRADVTYAPIDLRSGAVDSWTVNDDSLSKARSKHSTLVSGGYLFVSSGLYSAAAQGSSENTYAQINSDGTIGEFNGATGSNTLQSEGGTNLFNQASISYVDGDGVAHVLIIGGDDVNSPGNKQTDVMYY